MILRIIILACAVISPSFGKMDFKKFKKFEQNCFQNDRNEQFRINGQDIPLSNTMENFISMAEKFEAANPSFDLKDELIYFISEYLFENIKFVNGIVNEWKIGRARFDTVTKLWDPDQIGYKPTAEDPFTDDEKCNLYFMISHSILDKDVQLLRDMYSPGNFSSNFNRAAELNIDDYYPQELGAVAIRGTEAAVSLSKVLLGLYVGLLPNRKTDLSGYDTIKELDLPEENYPKDRTVDALYAVTLAEILMQSTWGSTDRYGLAPNAKWVSTPLGPDKTISGFCPMVYKHEKITVQNKLLPAYSYSSIRGATDGLILGLSIHSVYQKKAASKLSQILRMYYSPDGITLETPIEETTINRISFCKRQALLQSVQNKLPDQMLSYGYLIAENWEDVEKPYTDAKHMFEKNMQNIYNNVDPVIQKYCARANSLDKPEDLPRETFLDVLVVLDSSSNENSFQEQQQIVGYLAKELDLRYTGSRMTILLDKKITSRSGSSSKIELEPVVTDTYSSSCAACIVGQIPYEQSAIEREQVIVAINQLLQERKENETQYNGVNGKVVIYFNYESDDGRNNNRIQGRLEKALRELHLNNQDVLFYAIGLDTEILKKYAKNDPALVELSTDGTPEVVASRIAKRITYAPAKLQYSDCKDAKNEKAATYDNFVSPYKLQYYQMPAEYFYKSFGLTVYFESQNGYIKVCHNRVTMRPENEAKFCRNTTKGNAIDFKLSNPCKGLDKESCPPFYFTIMGMESNGEMRSDNRPRDYCNDIKDHWCSTLDQIKYKVFHEGIRCSGCLGLGASHAVILFTLFLTHFVYKRF